MKPRVYIFSRAPIFGLAKTRLAADIGKVHAHRIYKGMIAKVIKRAIDSRWEVIISGTPSKSLGEVIEWQGLGQVSQAKGTLSDKLNKIFRKMAGDLGAVSFFSKIWQTLTLFAQHFVLNLVHSSFFVFAS